MKKAEEMTVFYERVGSRIQKKRNLKDISQEQLADMVGLSPITIHNIETGATKTSAYNFCQIAQALDVSMLSLVYDEFSEEDMMLKEYFLRVVDLDKQKKSLVISIIKTLIESFNEIE